MAKKLNRTLPDIQEPKEPMTRETNGEITAPKQPAKPKDAEVLEDEVKTHPAPIAAPNTTQPPIHPVVPSAWLEDLQSLMQHVPEAVPPDPSDFKKTSLRYERELYESIEEIHYLLRLQSGASAPHIQDIVNTALELFLAVYRHGTRTPVGAWLLKRMYARRARSQRSQSRKMTGPRR